MTTGEESVLARKYSPKHLVDVFGQDAMTSYFRSVCKRPDEAHRNYTILGSFGCGKCVVGSTRILTNQGYKQIQDIVKTRVPDSFEDSDLVGSYGNIKACYYGGKKPVINVRTRYTEVIGTHNHRVKVLNGNGIEWKRLDAIQEGDQLVLQAPEIIFNNQIQVKTPEGKQLTQKELGWLLGFWLGDGSIGSKGSRFFHGNKKILDYVASLVGSIPRCSQDKRRTDLWVLAFHKADDEFFDKLGCFGNCYTKAIPEYVYSSNEEFIVGVLSGLMDSDGHKTKNNQNPIDFGLASPQLLKGIQEILNLLGSFPSIKDSKRLLLSRTMMTRMIKLDLHEEHKALSWSKIRESVDGNARGCSINLEGSFLEEIKSIIGQISYSREERKQVPLIANIRGKTSVKVNFSSFVDWLALERVQDIVSEEDRARIRGLAELRVAPVFEVQVLGQEEVFDVTVPETESFWASGLIQHNTSTVRAFARDLLGIDDLTRTPNYVEIDSSEHSIVEDFNQFRDFVFQEVPGYKVVVLDEVHLMEPTQQQKFLKPIEDFVGKIFFFFVSTEEDGIIPTIQSRCLPFYVYSFTDQQLELYLKSILEKEGVILNEETIRHIAFSSYGHMRNLLNQTQICLFQGEEYYLQQYTKMDKAVDAYFRGSEFGCIEELIKTPFEILRKAIEYFMMNVIIKNHGVFKQNDIPKIFIFYLKMKKCVVTENDFYSFLYAFKEFFNQFQRVK